MLQMMWYWGSHQDGQKDSLWCSVTRGVSVFNGWLMHLQHKHGVWHLPKIIHARHISPTSGIMVLGAITLTKLSFIEGTLNKLFCWHSCNRKMPAHMIPMLQHTLKDVWQLIKSTRSPDLSHIEHVGHNKKKKRKSIYSTYITFQAITELWICCTSSLSFWSLTL